MPANIIESQNAHYRQAILSPDETQIISHNDDGIGIHSSFDDNSQTLHVKNSGVYSMDWYPAMKKGILGSSCFIASIKDHPVQLFDSITGKLRYSYKTKDNADEVSAPLTAKFNLSGNKIYCGFDGSIQIFDLNGDLFDLVKLTPNRKSKEGLKDFNPDYSGIYCCGSFMGMIGLYDERNNDEFCMLVDSSIKFGPFNGITQAVFSKDGRYLLSASRNHSKILCWDIRNSGDVLHRIDRPGLTNQRLYFDTIHDQVYSGDINGTVSVYTISTGILIKQWQASISPISACSISLGKYLITCSGQREFPMFGGDNLSNECSLKSWPLI